MLKNLMGCRASKFLIKMLGLGHSLKAPSNGQGENIQIPSGPG